MPPKAKFTKEEVVSAALDILREHGKEGLTARALGQKLGSSARPIFTLFSGMDEIFREAERAAQELYNKYVEAGLSESIPFKGVGRSYLRFAKEEPKLFQLFFFGERKATKGDVLFVIEENYRAILNSIVTFYRVDMERARELYFHSWVYTHGIASLIATGMCTFSEEECNAMLTTVFKGIYREIGGTGI